ncbi:Uncharacterised protein [Legionella busanensis]|uniref:Winged helix-turn helix domain-containing protein n=2 Tax=Legionella busanensis TaxID=190655 RepID=A0A378JR58_9GAMM|nr:Uncharacterised protein [Legionella busanensis]
MIQKLITLQFNFHYSDRGIRQLMYNLRFSSQKPIKKAYQKYATKIVTWLTETYPAIKAGASRERARIYWGDDIGIHSTDNRGRTYALVGNTPVITIALN